MDADTAYLIATRAHAGQADRFREPLIDHVARVASSVPAEAKPVAWLHDVLERTDTSLDMLHGEGLTATEESALVVLSRRRGEPYETYTLRLAFAAGPGGRLARIVKHADLDDHIAQARVDVDVPPYAWARRHIENAQWRNREAASAS